MPYIYFKHKDDDITWVLKVDSEDVELTLMRGCSCRRVQVKFTDANDTHKLTLSLYACLSHVKSGSWIEITKEQANELIKKWWNIV